MNSSSYIIFAVVLIICLAGTIAFPQLTHKDTYTGSPRHKEKRSTMKLIDSIFQSSKCAIDDDFHSVCYLCGRTYDSMEIYSQCCTDDDQYRDLITFCEKIVAR